MQNDVIKFPLVKPLAHSSFDPDALRVYKKLRDNQHKTYFVGGCVRDLLLGKTPKDFDIATSANPNQVHRLFGNSRIIGRRFLIVSVFFGQKMIEVTTFRRSPWKEGMPENGSLLLNSDNVFGTDEEDALRRDFTINALFYDMVDRTVIDYVNGLYDLQYGWIRCIGDPEVRFCEDPVRIIRALKLQAILGFRIEPITNHAISGCVGHIRKIAPARLLLEITKMLRSGFSYECFESLAENSIFSTTVPDIHRLWNSPQQSSGILFRQMLRAMDRLNSVERSKLSDNVLLSPIYFPILFYHRENNKNYVGNITDFCIQKLSRLGTNLNISQRIMERFADTLKVQAQINNPTMLQKNKKILRHPLFRDALDMFYISGQGDAKKQELYFAWKEALQKELPAKKKKR